MRKMSDPRVYCGGEKEFQVLKGTENAVLWGSSHAELRESSHAVLRGSSHAVLRGSSHAVLWDSSHAVLWDSSHAVLRESSHAELRESSHAVLRGSSHAVLRGSSHAELRESSHAALRGSSHAVLRGSSHAVLRESSHAVLWDSSHAELRESSHAVGSKYSSITLHGQTVHAKGGMQIKIPEILTAKEWCDYYGVEVKKGIATLFKAVDDDYSTLNARSKGIFYTPGSMPIAPDWDGGKAECGGGLHASCHPTAALYFNPQAKKFVALPVRLKDFKPYANAQYPDKVKFKSVCAPVWECDKCGNKI